MSTQPETSNPRTLIDVFFRAVERALDCVMLHEQGGEWVAISSEGLYQRVVGVARALQSLGINRGDRVVVLSENRPEWTIADFAVLSLGAVTVPVYSTLIAEQCEFPIRHSGARAVFVSTAEQLLKVKRIARDFPVEHIIMMDAPPEGSGAHSMAEMMEAGPCSRDAAFDANAHRVAPTDLATIIYTSGTTGTLKGAMLTHGNIASNLQVSLEGFDIGPPDVAISFLPLSHITARHADFAELLRGVTLAYCPFLEDLQRILGQIRPTMFVGVPRVYEKVYNGVQRKVADSGLARRLYRWALRVGTRHSHIVLGGERPRSLAWRIADRLVFSKVSKGMGGRVRIFISGGAPLGRELAEWYAEIGIRIHEGYGLTETSPVIAVNTPAAHRLGSVGRPRRNLEIRFATDGELQVRGPSVFTGYWDMPQETADAFEDGWFKTSDIASLDADGYLSITDRKKDLIKTSGGKFIAPQPIENSLKANPLISEAAVIGNCRRFACVVIAPAFATLEHWAQEHQVSFSGRGELVADPRVQALYTQIVEQVNETLARYEKLKKVLVIPRELSVEDGTLTPTLKLRRRNLEACYREDIEQLYADPSVPSESPVS